MSKSSPFDSASGALCALCRFSKGLLLLITLGIHSVVDLVWLVAIQCGGTLGRFLVVLFICLFVLFLLVFHCLVFSSDSATANAPTGGVPANACHGTTRAFNGFLLLPESSVMVVLLDSWESNLAVLSS